MIKLLFNSVISNGVVTMQNWFSLDEIIRTSEQFQLLLRRHSQTKIAIRKGISFELSKEEFREITQRKCHYCGAMPSSESYRGNRDRVKTGAGWSTYVYNGLDRIDSSEGYTLSNVVACCGICNHAKHTMSYATFVAWLNRIVTFHRDSC